ncbi:MAG: tRNA dihydrouridine synthase DusB [Thermoanaerobaculales bacterium]|jgi:nifR3 family TIM-barrel protein|nr:tRNA dihydrouridine synthase DusB [Thermoanaerobaculales bacterium]
MVTTATRIGPIALEPPVVLAPMAGVTNYPFRALCRRFGAALFVSEMITARALVEGAGKTRRLADFGPDESPRSLQLYGVDPVSVGEAVRWLVGEGRVDHIDLNFGCPVRKVTRKGGGAAIPVKPRLLAAIVRAAVAGAGSVPVTIKFRMGIDDELLTFLQTGRIAEAEGCAAVTLHARTAAQLYDGEARWAAIGELKRAVSTIPVFGNGDIWQASDALRMIDQTGCDGVAIGRGCLGRPWLFRDLADAFAGRTPAPGPTFGEVADIMVEHARMLVEWFGDEPSSMLSFRKHAGWYTKGFRASARLREKLMRVATLAGLAEALADIDRDEPYPGKVHLMRRGKRPGTQKVVLPEGFLDDLDDAAPPTEDDREAISGG